MSVHNRGNITITDYHLLIHVCPTCNQPHCAWCHQRRKYGDVFGSPGRVDDDDGVRGGERYVGEDVGGCSRQKQAVPARRTGGTQEDEPSTSAWRPAVMPERLTTTNFAKFRVSMDRYAFRMPLPCCHVDASHDAYSSRQGSRAVIPRIELSSRPGYGGTLTKILIRSVAWTSDCRLQYSSFAVTSPSTADYWIKGTLGFFACADWLRNDQQCCPER